MRNLIFGFVVILLCSCSRVLYDISYKGETNYKEFYIVDTILIESPVRVFSEKYGGMFVLSNENQYRDWETDRKSTRLNSSHRSLSRMPSSA